MREVVPINIVAAIELWTEADIERIEGELDWWEAYDPRAREFLELAIDYRLFLLSLERLD